MKKSVESEAETTEQAIESGLEELGVNREQVAVEVIEQPNKGLLGLRKAKAKVRLTVVDVEAAAETTIKELLENLNTEATFDTHREADELWITLRGEASAWLIGHHGQTLDALQVLTTSIINRKLKRSSRVVIDVEGYRERRKKDVKAIAERTVGKVMARQEAISLRPMNAQDRKVVHLVVGEYDGVISASTGGDPNRFVIISPA